MFQILFEKKGQQKNELLPEIQAYSTGWHNIVILRTRMQETFWVDTASYCASLPRNLSLIVNYALFYKLNSTRVLIGSYL